MKRQILLIAAALTAWCSWTSSPTRLFADDPLKAMPTADDPVDAKVKRLTVAEKEAIQLPKRDDQVVFSIAQGFTSSDKQDPESSSKPWLVVYADGRIDCINHHSPLVTERCNDQLSKDELSWLLHLVVNECRGLVRSTADIKKDYELSGGKWPATGKPTDGYRYHVHLSADPNEFMIPERALSLQPLRGKLNLIAFGSLNRYANFLVARAYLGQPKERLALLRGVNEKLKEVYPEIPPFLFEHLGGAGHYDNIDLSARFEQVIDLGDNRFRRVSARILRQKAGEEPVYTIQTMDFSKYRP